MQISRWALAVNNWSLASSTSDSIREEGESEEEDEDEDQDMEEEEDMEEDQELDGD